MVETRNDKDWTEDALMQAKPIIGNLTFGALMGYCSGTALVKVGRAVATIIGLGFISLQTAASLGYIKVDWEKIRIDCVGKLDSTADRQITQDDVLVWWRKFKATMTHRLPSAGGFSLGFLYGVRSG
jgi:uncharacterized membrane protein (Fun14 family)